MSSNHCDRIKFENVNKKNTTPVLSKGLNRTIKEKPLGERRKAVLRQKLMVFLGNTGVMGAGMAVALPSVTLGQLTDTTESFHISEEEASWFCMLVFAQLILMITFEKLTVEIKLIAASINTMACPLGGLLVGYLLDRVGRKNTIVLTDFCGVLGWALLATAPLHRDSSAVFIQILVARFLSGTLIAN